MSSHFHFTITHVHASVIEAKVFIFYDVRPVAFQYVGIPENDFPNQADPGVNYYDSNINIALPVFTIHGNHDDPIGTDLNYE